MGSPLLAHYADRLQSAIAAKSTAAVVGIDPVLERLPPALCAGVTDNASAAAALAAFARDVIEVVAPLVPAVKINSAFFEAFGAAGVAAFFASVAEARRRGLLVISDIKRGDIGSTATLYARGHLGSPEVADELQVPDAVTVAGYLGVNAVRPFAETAAATGRGLYVLVRPSDPGADEIHEFGGERPLYRFLAERVAEWGSLPERVGATGLSCVGAVVAPKDAESTRALRAAMPNTPFLVPGYGAQGGTAEACRACFREDGRGAAVNASRSVIYAYEDETRLARCEGDWKRCIESAAREFAADIAGIMEG